MIKVLHVISGLGRGGAEGVLHGLLTAEDRSVFESRVISLTDDGVYGPLLRESGIGVDVVSMPGGLPSPRFRWKLRRRVRAFQPDVVCGWMYRGNLAAVWAAADAGGVPAVWNIRHSLHHWAREPWLFRLTVLANRLWVRKASLVLYNSEACRTQHRDFGFRARQDAVVQNGFDLERFRPNPVQRALVRTSWGLEQNSCAVGLLARWHPIKNHEGFFAAVAEVLGDHPEVVLVLAGEGIVSSNRELGDLIERFGLANRIRLLGPIDRVDQVLVSLDLVVSASWGEAFPNVVGEALACGVPCLATDVGESRVLVGSSGRVVGHGELGRALGGLLDLGNEGLAQLGAEGRRQMERNYGHGRMVEQYAGVLQSQVTR